jgi:hypothetical protein
VISEELLDTTLILRFILQGAHVLKQQLPHRVCGFEFQRQYSMRGEDAQEHLYPLLDLLNTAEPFINSCLHPARHWLALLLIPPEFGGDPLHFFLGDPLHPALQGHERCAGR